MKLPNIKIPAKLKNSKLYIPLVLLCSSLIVHGIVFVVKDGASAIRYNSQVVTTKSKQTAYENLDRQISTIRFDLGEIVAEKDMEEFGVTYSEVAIQGAVDRAYSSQKYIPVWGIYSLLKTADLNIYYQVDIEKLRQSAELFSQEISSEPIDAKLEQKEQEVVVVEDQKGVSYDPAVVESLVKTFVAHKTDKNTVKLSGAEKQPEISAESLRPIVERFSTLTSNSLNVEVDRVSFVVEPAEILNLIDINTSEIQLNVLAVSELIASWSKEVSVTPGITQIEYVDDVEVNRTTGATGKTLDLDPALEALQGWFEGPTEQKIVLATTPVSPKIVASRIYTSSSAELQANLEALVAARSGTFRIAVRELGGQGREASVNESSRTVMASTYKVFLSTVAYKLSENNELSLNTVISGGRTIEQCIEVGIVYSDNECMIALGRYIGWSKVDAVLYDMGFRNITLNNYAANGSLSGDKLAPASEQAKILALLSGGSLISRTNTTSLIGYMKRQTYRAGIPDGSSGSVVANKVGFYDEYIHDMGIVYGPNSTYALVILTSSASWIDIRDAAAAVYDFMN